MSGGKDDIPKVRTFSSAETNELLESMMNYPGILEDSMGMVCIYSSFIKSCVNIYNPLSKIQLGQQVLLLILVFLLWMVLMVLMM